MDERGREEVRMKVFTYYPLNVKERMLSGKKGEAMQLAQRNRRRITDRRQIFDDVLEQWKRKLDRRLLSRRTGDRHQWVQIVEAWKNVFKLNR